MSKSRSSSRPSRCKRVAGWACAAAASLTTVLTAPEAGATKSEPAAETMPQPALGTTVFGIQRLSWTMPPPLQLQPERARLMLVLPVEWMPATDYGFLAAFEPYKRWEFQRDQRQTQATIGTSFRLRVTDPEHSIDFRLRLMPRAAIAVLHFDPTAGVF